MWVSGWCASGHWSLCFSVEVPVFSRLTTCSGCTAPTGALNENGWRWETSFLPCSSSWSAFPHFCPAHALYSAVLPHARWKKKPGAISYFFPSSFQFPYTKKLMHCCKTKRGSTVRQCGNTMLRASLYSQCQTWRFLYGVLLTEMLSIPVLENKNNSFWYVCLFLKNIIYSIFIYSNFKSQFHCWEMLYTV